MRHQKNKEPGEAEIFNEAAIVESAEEDTIIESKESPEEPIQKKEAKAKKKAKVKKRGKVHLNLK